MLLLQVVGVAQSFCEVWETVTATLAVFLKHYHLNIMAIISNLLRG